MTNVPPAVVPYSTLFPDEVEYLGSNTWSFSQRAASSMIVPAVPNYAGEDPYPNLEIFAVTQELDGDQATSPAWLVDFAIAPVIDGLSNYNLNSAISEDTNEVNGADIPLNVTLNFNLIDGVDVGDNPAEQPLNVTFDFSTLIDDAQIRTRLYDLALNETGTTLNSATELQFLIDNYLTGYNATSMDFDVSTGLLTVPIDLLGGLSLQAKLFFQSNIDFSIRLFLLVREFALGIELFQSYSGALSIDLEGSADPPTVFVNNASGLSQTNIPLDLGGAITDTDVALGRPPSESLYFIVTEVQAYNMSFDYKFVNSAGELLGSDRGGAW